MQRCICANTYTSPLGNTLTADMVIVNGATKADFLTLKITLALGEYFKSKKDELKAKEFYLKAIELIENNHGYPGIFNSPYEAERKAAKNALEEMATGSAKTTFTPF